MITTIGEQPKRFFDKVNNQKCTDNDLVKCLKEQSFGKILCMLCCLAKAQCMHMLRNTVNYRVDCVNL